MSEHCCNGVCNQGRACPRRRDPAAPSRQAILRAAGYTACALIIIAVLAIELLRA